MDLYRHVRVVKCECLNPVLSKTPARQKRRNCGSTVEEGSLSDIDQTGLGLRVSAELAKLP